MELPEERAWWGFEGRAKHLDQAWSEHVHKASRPAKACTKSGTG